MLRNLKEPMDKNIAAFLDTTAYTVHVVFSTSKAPKAYTYICNIPGVKAGDWVVVDAPDYDASIQAREAGIPHEWTVPKAPNAMSTVLRGIPKLVLVVGVDPDVSIAPDSDKEYGWVIATLDMTAYRETLARNSQINGLVADAYKAAMRKSFAERILGDMSTDNKDKLLSLLHKQA